MNERTVNFRTIGNAALDLLFRRRCIATAAEMLSMRAGPTTYAITALLTSGGTVLRSKILAD